MSEYSIEDIIDVLVVTFNFNLDSVYEPIDDYMGTLGIEWDQGKDPIGASVKVSEDKALLAVKHFLKNRKGAGLNSDGSPYDPSIPYDEEKVKNALNEAHRTSLSGYNSDTVKDIIAGLDTKYGFGKILNNIQSIENIVAGQKSPDFIGDFWRLPADIRQALNDLISLRSNGDMYSKREYNFALAALPQLSRLLDSYSDLRQKEEKYLKDKGVDPTQLFVNSFMSVFSKQPLQMALFYKENTQRKISEAFAQQFQRPNNDPQPVQPWEMRIGGSKFFVPPIDVKVSQFFKSGSLTGGAIRQATSPKFNSGHSETAIQITLYFPGQESIWGIVSSEEKPEVLLNFDDISKTSDKEIDYFLSSLRGLIAQFKYAPFLPVRNQYLNQAWGITGVTLNSMTISTVENYPFCVAVTLNMMKFNHKVFLPMIEDFNQAVHWGRFRQYMGRAAKAMQDSYNMGFLTESLFGDLLDKIPFFNRTTPKPDQDLSGLSNEGFSRPTKAGWAKDPTRIKFYYPSKTPMEIFAPDDSMFRQEREDETVGSSDYERDKSAWELFLGKLGINTDTYPESLYDNVKNYSQRYTTYTNEWTYLSEYLKFNSVVIANMTPDKLRTFLKDRISTLQKDGSIKTQADIDKYTSVIVQRWYDVMFGGFKDTVFYRKLLENTQYRNGSFTINEWEVPMEEMSFDPKSIFIQGISVSLSNNFAKHQVQLQDEPTYQHIGGGDNRVDISMIAVGEDNLIRIRRMFERIGGLARLEHAHGVLGFLGVKNELTGLAGMKYLMPLTYEVDTIPGYPRVYNVRLSFIDFDVFQQKREKLSSDLQNELTELFGKRNPFLRVKQVWGRFNAYPDFPLTMRDEKNNKVIGTIDPDFYFRAFTTIDDDLTYWGSIPSDDQNPVASMKPDGSYQLNAKKDDITAQMAKASGDVKTEQYTVDKKNRVSTYPLELYFNMLTTGDGQDTSAIVKLANAGELIVGKQAANEDPKFPTSGKPVKMTEDTSVATQTEPSISGLTPGALVQNPYANATNDPSTQYELIMNDAKYRDINGRMIRAFPTYMLWLIDEGGRFGGVKLFDNFYGLQSVVDFSINRSEDVLGDTLVLRLSNLYSKLTTPYKGFVTRQDGTENIVLGDDNGNVIESISDIPEHAIQVQENIKSGMKDDYVVELDSIRLKPGVRVHMRMGYGANPNSLENVFNGVITQVQAGDIVEVVAQSDAIELSQYINSTNKKGHSGKIDGSIGTGFWLSEPRDLMVRLLSMGSSGFKEAFAHATLGQVFSENRFGIRHFGTILYESLNDQERQRHEKRAKAVENRLQAVAGASSVSKILGESAKAVYNPSAGDSEDSQNSLIGGNFNAFLGGAALRGDKDGVSTPLLGVMQSMWVNFFTKRDFEIYKRNIYPGNGTGVAQYLGGDLLDAGPILLEAAAPGSKAATDMFFNKDAKSIFSQFKSGQPGKDPTSQVLQDTIINLALSGQRVEDLTSPTNNTAPNTANPNALANQGASGREQADVSIPTLLLGPVGEAVLMKRGALKNSPILQALGLVQGGETDTDLNGFDEVSFRAQTYMKTVWDMFKLCAALLPNYIVAVRPFEDRSTVFYGKPHWLYTSGVIPLSTGVPKSDDTLKDEKPDAKLEELLREATNQANPIADLEKQMKFVKDISTANPFTSFTGTQTPGSGSSDAVDTPNEVMTLPLTTEDGAKIPIRSGKVLQGKHLNGYNLESQSNSEIDLNRIALSDKIEILTQYAEERKADLASRSSEYLDQYTGAYSEEYTRLMQKLDDFLGEAVINEDEEKINSFIEDPDFSQDIYRRLNTNTQAIHKELESLPDVFKYSNFNAGSLFVGFEGGSPKITPDGEQWYIRMRWPYINWQDYLKQQWESAEGNSDPKYADPKNYWGKKVAVSLPDSGKVVVCYAIDGGPMDPAFRAEVSPDVYYSLDLGAYHDKDCYFGFVSDSTRLGPVGGGLSTELGQRLDTSNIPSVTKTLNNDGRSYDTIVDPSDAYNQLKNSVDTTQTTGNKSPEEILFDEKYYFINSFLYGWLAGGSGDRPRASGYYGNFDHPDKNSDAQFADKYISLVDNNIKNTIRAENDSVGAFDIVGEIARRIYDVDYNKRRAELLKDKDIATAYMRDMGISDYPKLLALAEQNFKAFENARKFYGDTYGGENEEAAESIWDTFRSEWHIRTDKKYLEVKEAAIEFINQIRLPINDPNNNLGFDEYWYDGASSGQDFTKSEEGEGLDKVLFSTNMTKIVNNFKMLLWRLPYARAWLVITTGRNPDTTGLQTAGIAGAAGTLLTGNPAALVGAAGGAIVDSYLRDDPWSFKTSDITKLWKWYLGLNADGYKKNDVQINDLINAAALDNESNFNGFSSQLNLSPDAKTGATIFRNETLVNNLIGALKHYKTVGLKGNAAEQAVERVGQIWNQTVGAFFTLVSSALSGVVATFRLSLMQMGYGMGMLGAMQQQANILNRALNDSIYYSLGEPGSAIWLADNPFTREYGEPVIEIREPFQRFHYINSFQDIIDNGIQEKIDNVPTVVTASSDGKYPVTVYFDKGASPERQFEVGIETGLFWDNARGSGFFGFLHPLLHPIETMRGLAKSASGSSDEILSRRVGLSYLKESLKDIYGGEIVIIGRADIRPHDLVYLADTYERMYGIFEVEAVTHHFTSDMGFVTAITPNAVVTVNDPARWVYQSWIWGLFGVQNTRNHVRHLLSVTADRTSKVYSDILGFVKENGEVDMTGFAESIEDTIRGSMQFTGGNTGLVKDIAAHAAAGYAVPGEGGYSIAPDSWEKNAENIGSLFASPAATLGSWIPGVNKMLDIAWDGWTWVRDNLLDQHGCYIQYLSKNGQPMDAGLSFNQGVAVGHHHSINLLPGILGVDINTVENGHRRITINDLMGSLGWSELEISSIQRQVSWWNNYWNARVLDYAGRGPDPVTLTPPNAYLARVISMSTDDDDGNGIVDGDTFSCQKLDATGNPTGSTFKIRLAGINTPELDFKQDIQRNDFSQKAYIARQFLEKRLITDQVTNGLEPIIAVRESIGAGVDGRFGVKDKYGRTLAVVFHNGDYDKSASTATKEKQRRDSLLRNASSWPLIPWDSFTADGRAYTVNWEIVVSGLAYTDMGGVRAGDPDARYGSGNFTGGN